MRCGRIKTSIFSLIISLGIYKYFILIALNRGMRYFDIYNCLVHNSSWIRALRVEIDKFYRLKLVWYEVITNVICFRLENSFKMQYEPATEKSTMLPGQVQQLLTTKNFAIRKARKIVLVGVIILLVWINFKKSLFKLIKSTL